jgi:hypothetical protein
MKKINEVARMQKLAGLNESFDSLVHKLEKGGKSEKAADKIAGAINAKYVHHYREGIEENTEGYNEDWLTQLKEFCDSNFPDATKEELISTLEEYINQLEDGGEDMNGEIEDEY